MLFRRLPNVCFVLPTLSVSGNTRAANCSVRNMSNTTGNSVIVQEFGKAGVLTLNGEKGLNILTNESISQVIASLRAWESTRSIVVIKGNKKVFCAGGNVIGLTSPNGLEEGIKVIRKVYTTNSLINKYKIPYVALISGITMGGGVGLAIHSRYRIATETTVFAMPEALIGFYPDIGSSYFLPRLKNNIGYYFGLTGYRLKGKDVVKAGIATHFIEYDRLGELQEKLVKCQGYTDVDKVLKETCVEDNSEFVLQKYLPQIEKCFSGKTVEEIIENLERDGSDWAKSTLKIIGTISPTSLKVILRQLQLGSKMNLDECLKMEMRMTVRHMEKSDFQEGVRALFIDKDRNPQWNPKTVAEVTEESVNRFFMPLPDNLELKLDDVNSKL